MYANNMYERVYIYCIKRRPKLFTFPNSFGLMEFRIPQETFVCLLFFSPAAAVRCLPCKILSAYIWADERTHGLGHTHTHTNSISLSTFSHNDYMKRTFRFCIWKKNHERKIEVDLIASNQNQTDTRIIRRLCAHGCWLWAHIKMCKWKFMFMMMSLCGSRRRAEQESGPHFFFTIFT